MSSNGFYRTLRYVYYNYSNNNDHYRYSKISPTLSNRFSHQIKQYGMYSHLYHLCSTWWPYSLLPQQNIPLLISVSTCTIIKWIYIFYISYIILNEYLDLSTFVKIFTLSLLPKPS